MNLLLILALVSADKAISVKTLPNGPRIDGRLEALWGQADSVSDFFQTEPVEGAEPGDRTVVYVMQDAQNLYVGFRCHSMRQRPLAQLYGLEDEVTLFLDPMDTRQTGYFFKLYGSGLLRSGLLLDDGRSWDWSWEGVWYGATALSDSVLEAEIRVPFKSIRYKKDATEWGINFHRAQVSVREEYQWIEAREQEGGMAVSKFGRLRGINPQAHGYYFELYPEGYVRYDWATADSGKVKPFASLNFKWDMTPQSTINATVLPDFAQIESDPYSFNISRYPTYFGERRPFFVEGSDLFRMSQLGMGDFSPLNIFYSRRIGRPVQGEPVPILGGLKFTSRSTNWSFGGLGAFTDQAKDATGSVIEPRRAFATLTGQTGLAGGSNLGLLLTGMQDGGDDYNYAAGLDWSLSQGPNRAIIQGALSDRRGRVGWALNSGYGGFLANNLAAVYTFQTSSDSFNVDEIGYMPWAGRTHFSAQVGPYLTPRNGALRRLMVLPQVEFTREPGSRDLSYSAGLYVNPILRNRVYTEAGASIGRSSENVPWLNPNRDIQYNSAHAHFAVNLNTSVMWSLGFGGNFNRGMNYARGYVAPNYSGWANFTYYLFGKVALMMLLSNYWEATPDNDIAAVTTIANPRIDFRFNDKFNFNIYDQVVLTTPGTQFDSTSVAQNRVGFLFSWNFRPKSWLYVALNDVAVDRGNGLEFGARVAAVKLRYLFYF
jgi:hypothetical protein